MMRRISGIYNSIHKLLAKADILGQATIPRLVLQPPTGTSASFQEQRNGVASNIG